MEAQIKKIDKQIERLQRRSAKVATGLITPYPISHVMTGDDIQGAILKYMFPCDGVITKGIIKLGEKPKGLVSIETDLVSEITSSARGFVIERLITKIDVNLKVAAGDCLTVSLKGNVDHPVKEIWISFLWTPSMKDIEAKSFLIDELEAIIP